MNNLKKIEIKSGIYGVKANYTTQEIEDYSGNPLIEALPQLKTRNQIINELSTYPVFSEKEKDLDRELRCHLVYRLNNFFQPMECHIELYNKIELMIRQGYINRNPIKKEFVNCFNRGYESILHNNIELNTSDIESSALSSTLFGISGIGKTTSVNKIISKLPQIIVHSKYKRKTLTMLQIVWIKIEMPHDGSLKSFCLSVFSKIDMLLGTEYYKKYGSGYIASNVMLQVIVQIFRNLNVGILIIDEIQNIEAQRNGGYQKILNFFLMLINTINVSVLIIGTPQAISLIQSEFRTARRNSSIGGVLWDRLENDDEFELILSGLWRYQWTKEYIELDRKLIDLMYTESQGITDVLVKIYILAQQKAIRIGREKIDSCIIKTILNEELQLIKPIIESLKNISESTKTPSDIYIPNIELEKNNKIIVVPNKEYIKEDLRSIVNINENEKINIYEKFKEEGIIKSHIATSRENI